MSFEMLGSRYLNPYFGSGIYTWASLISTVLAALCMGYFIGGVAADRYPSAAVLGATVLVGSLYILVLPAFSERLMESVFAAFDDVRTGSLAAAFVILFFPVTFLGMYSPFGIRLLLQSAQSSGRVSGTVYGVSTLGSIIGTLGTTFILIPSIGTRAITFTLGIAGVLSGLALIAAPKFRRARACARTARAGRADVRAEDVVDQQVRAEMLQHKDGRVAHLETQYNDIFISKKRHELMLSFQWKGEDYTESVANLIDPDDLPVKYTQVMMAALAYPPEVKRVLMLGLGGGSISTYLGRFLPAPRSKQSSSIPACWRPRRNISAFSRRRACVTSRATAGLPQPAQGNVRPDPGRCLSGRVRPVPPADQGILHVAQAAAGARRGGGFQRARRHQALRLDIADAARGISERAPLPLGRGRGSDRGDRRTRAGAGDAQRARGRACRRNSASASRSPPCSQSAPRRTTRAIPAICSPTISRR
jgi:hypothetical protein